MDDFRRGELGPTSIGPWILRVRHRIHSAAQSRSDRGEAVPSPALCGAIELAIALFDVDGRAAYASTVEELKGDAAGQRQFIHT